MRQLWTQQDGASRRRPAALVLAAVALAFASCTATPAPAAFRLPVAAKRGPLVQLDAADGALRLPGRFRGRWSAAAGRCHADRAQHDIVELRADRLTGSAADPEVPYIAIRGYSGFVDAVEVQVTGIDGALRLLFLTIAPDHQSLRITKGGERAVDGLVTGETLLLRRCPIGS